MARPDGFSTPSIADEAEKLTKILENFPEQGLFAKYGRSLGIFVLTALGIVLAPIIEDTLYGRKLEYKIIGPIAIDNTISVQVVLVNGGKQREKDIEIFLPADFPKFPTIEAEQPLEVSSTAEETILKLAGLNGRSSLPISILAEGALKVDSKDWQHLNVSTEDTIARFDDGTAPDYLITTFLALFIYISLLINIGLDAYATRRRTKWFAGFKAELEEDLEGLHIAAYKSQANLNDLQNAVYQANEVHKQLQANRENVEAMKAEIRAAKVELGLLTEDLVSKNARCANLIDEVRDILESLRWAYRHRADEEQIKRCISRIDSGLRERLTELKGLAKSEALIDSFHS